MQQSKLLACYIFITFINCHKTQYYLFFCVFVFSFIRTQWPIKEYNQHKEQLKMTQQKQGFQHIINGYSENFEPTHQNQQKHNEKIMCDYYEEYKKIYLSSYLLSIQTDKLIGIKTTIEERLKKMEKKFLDFNNAEGSEKTKRSRSRRTAEEIQRVFACQQRFCGKCYGSEGSLQQHIKNKHPQIYQPRK